MINERRHMTKKPESTDKIEQPEDTSPDYWVETYKGMAAGIVVPPYIRFLQGALVLRKAYGFLQAAQISAMTGNKMLSEEYLKIEESRDSKQLGVNYQTFFASHLVINLVSEVEHFFGNAVSAALRMYPEKMGGQTFKLSEIVSASSKDELVDRAARTVLNELLYEKPLEYLKKFAAILSVDSRDLEADWPAFVELKTRRDLGVHNNWVVNEIYLRKVREAHIQTNYKLGDRVIPDFAYLKQAMDDCDKLIDTLANILGAKWVPGQAADLGLPVK
jgi:hypothetical protein